MSLHAKSFSVDQLFAHIENFEPSARDIVKSNTAAMPSRLTKTRKQYVSPFYALSCYLSAILRIARVPYRQCTFRTGESTYR